MDLLLSLLGMAALRLPVLIALAVSLVWVVDAPRGTIRSVALWSLALLLLASLAGLALNVCRPGWSSAASTATCRCCRGCCAAATSSSAWWMRWARCCWCGR